MFYRRTSRGSFRRDDRGVAMVELALTLPILLLVVWGIIDFGRLLVASNGLTNAAREGARYAAVLQAPTTSGNLALIKTVVRQSYVPLGADSLTDAEISVTTPTGGAPIVMVKITNYPWKTITPLGAMISAIASQSLTRQATFRWEWGT